MSFFKILSDDPKDFQKDECPECGQEHEDWIEIQDPRGNTFALPLEFLFFLADQYRSKQPIH